MVHITEEGVQLLEPLEVTRTHVVVNVSHLSLFGLVWTLRRIQEYLFPTAAQVLLFLQPPERRTRRLNVVMVPGNVPVKEVTSTSCILVI